MVKKVIIFGFPHCGTSILKSIIGHSSDVHEIENETDAIPDMITDKLFILCKFPFTKTDFFSRKYHEYIKIFIIRNPEYVFSSLNRRFSYDIPEHHSISRYISTAKRFLYHRDKSPRDNLYLLRYEDIFHNNFESIRALLNNIGIRYTDIIFNNDHFTNIHNSKISTVPLKEPSAVDHVRFRTYQINTPIENKNDPIKCSLTREQKRVIHECDTIKRLYQ